MFNSLWYYNLIRPRFAPPNSIFAPVWTFLYITIFAALIFYVLRKTDKNKFKGYLFFGIQLILNLLWSPVFFLAQNIGMALVIVILLDLFILLTIKHFYSVSKVSALILLPYLCWVIFATYLNFGYYFLN